MNFRDEYKFLINFYSQEKGKNLIVELKNHYNIRSIILAMMVKSNSFDISIKLNLIFTLLRNLVNNRLVFFFFKYLLKEEFFILSLCLY